jgi:shikimate kinase
VYLLARLGLLWKRVRRDRRRPLLQVADPRQRLRELSSEREPLYQETAHLVVDTEGMSFDCLVGETMERLRSERLR